MILYKYILYKYTVYTTVKVTLSLTWLIYSDWFVNKHLSIVAGYADLGSIAGLASQQGYYLSVEGAW